MPPTIQAHEAKDKFVAMLLSKRSDFYRPNSRRDWYVSKDGDTHIFITFSCSAELWYDMDETDLQELQLKKKGFVVFLLGSSDRFLSVPVREIYTRLSQHTAGLTENKRYTFRVHDAGASVRFIQLPSWELREYLNNLDFLK